ncbi:L,D-transpeptidase [Desulfurispirillum indicum]|uniref:ErfK/YbiS/YcfS/YnhG family protein n=1 Tax=Desulfurispirillum indicum (strain ATCC BAA-1389 / DSM 22839 / S5) TaxID=653733 RepID=E6W205_DESIS|nr:L,D-transpeptidase [Desulfurispirillum indicum]ADU66631.1 ErfK/YbiS/YcfS/YnhG family protein [Desulfurispirillum indicum S5]UCZ55948.1 L,D-transpeptidase [Desulfurispirillum indicum]
MFTKYSSRMLLCLFLLLSPLSALSQPDSRVVVASAGTSALTITADAPIFNRPDGDAIGTWYAGTPFTSNEESGPWLRITGYFPEGSWKAAPGIWWVHKEHVFQDIPQERSVEARTYEAVQLLYVRDEAGGETVLDTWEVGSRFTSNRQAGDWIRVTGYFPGDAWTPNRESWWVHRSGVRDITRPTVPLVPLKPGHSRYIVINKESFLLNVHEVDSRGQERIIYTALVGLGRDECMPREQGGNCYFTEPGEYAVRWKIYEPDGIEWCIPPSMEKEERYAADIAAGQRCFPGVLGNFALNIGKTYAIHGTRNLDSIGQRMSSGCIRTHNDVAEQLYKLMREGDRVVIQEGDS